MSTDDLPSVLARRYGAGAHPMPSQALTGPTYNVHDHYAYVRQLYGAYPLTDRAKCLKMLDETIELIIADLPTWPSPRIYSLLRDSIYHILITDEIFLPSILGPIPPRPDLDWIEYIAKPKLTKQEFILQHWDERIVNACTCMYELFSDLLLASPEGIYLKDNTTSIPMYELMHDPSVVIDRISIKILSAPAVAGTAPLFPQLCHTLFSNLYIASGHDPKTMKPGEKDPKFIFSTDSKLALDKRISVYLKDTPFEEFLMTPIPFEIPERIRFEHTHILGGSGHGKTTLLTQQILDDLAKPNPPALIVIDGKGTFVKELQQLEIIGASDRLITINPQDLTYPPALNMFAPKFVNAPDEMAAKLTNNAVSHFEYIFGARDFKLTAKQATCLAYCVRLLLSYRPVATIHTLLDLMGDPISRGGGIPETSPFRHHIDQQAPIVRRFFNDLFYHPTEYGETKRQIQNRIFDLLEHPAFAAMFSTTECKIDLFDVIQNRKILLVDSSPSSLGEKAAPLLGRYIIALTLSAAYARLGLPRSEWHPAFIVVDEAQMFVDEEKTQPLLQQAREFNLGVTLAHQKLADLTPTLTATLAANTSIRFVGGVSALDAAFMARNMGCDPEFIMGQRKTTSTTQFACHVRGYTERAVSMTTKLGLLQSAPQMNDDAQRLFMERNRLAISAPPLPDKPPPIPRLPQPVPSAAATIEPALPATPDNVTSSAQEISKKLFGKRRW